MTVAFDSALCVQLVMERDNVRKMLAAFREFGDSHLIRTKHGVYGTAAVKAALEGLLALADQLEAACAEVVRLSDCMRVAGLQCFLREGAPAEVSAHLRSVAESWQSNEVKITTERDTALAEAELWRGQVDQLSALGKRALDEKELLEIERDALAARASELEAAVQRMQSVIEHAGVRRDADG